MLRVLVQLPAADAEQPGLAAAENVRVQRPAPAAPPLLLSKEQAEPGYSRVRPAGERQDARAREEQAADLRRRKDAGLPGRLPVQNRAGEPDEEPGRAVLPAGLRTGDRAVPR